MRMYGTGKLVSRSRDTKTLTFITDAGWGYSIGLSAPATMLALFYFSCATTDRLLYRTYIDG